MAIEIQAFYPTEAHAQAADAVVAFFADCPEVDAVILIGSCARGRASRDSCVDILILVPQDVAPFRARRLEERWRKFYETEAVFQRLHREGKYNHVDLDFIDGVFKPHPREWASGPDTFELEVGNTLVYSVPLWQGSNYLDRLKARWLPYYDEGLRLERLEMVRLCGLSNLDHVPLYVERELYFQSFQRLYDALQEFLQALFIARRAYPIAYNKWIREQLREILGMPELYGELGSILEIDHFESRVFAEKAEILRNLYERHV